MSSQPANQQAPKRPKKLRRHHKPATTFSDHITELRRRVLWVGLFFSIGSVLAYSYRVPLMDAILAPLHGEKLVYLTPGGGFSFIFQISIYAGLIMAAPILLYHLHAFIKPALPVRAQHSASKIVVSAILLMIGGISYGYFIAVPNALRFLMDFAGDAISPNLTADSYLSFFLAYTGGLALLSLLPLFLIFWHWISPLTPGGLLKSERWVIVFAFVAAAIVTPTPDIVNQTMIAGPVIGLYQLGVFAVAGAITRTKKTTRTEQRRKQVLREAEERRIRSLKTRAAYLANATSGNIPAGMTDMFLDAAPSTIPDITAVSKNTPAVSAFTTAPSSPRPDVTRPQATANRQRLRYAGISTVGRQLPPTPVRQRNPQTSISL